MRSPGRTSKTSTVGAEGAVTWRSRERAWAYAEGPWGSSTASRRVPPPRFLRGCWGFWEPGLREGNFLGAKTTFGFFGVGARLFQGGLQFLVIKGDQSLSGLNGVAFANQDFVDAAANFRSDPNVACFDGAGAVQGAVAMKPAGVERRRGHHRGSDENDRDVLAIHELRS